MAERQRRANMWIYLPHSLVATTVVVLLPAAIVGAVILAADSEPPLLFTLLFGIALASVAAVLGHLFWKRNPQSIDVSFGELMIWGWYRRKRAEERLERGEQLLGLDRKEDLPRVVRVDAGHQLAILRDLTAALESKDPYTHGHSRRVEAHVSRTADAMGLSDSDITDLAMAASLHDVGKIRVPDRILRKQGELTIEERVLVEDHVLVGAWMVSSVGNADVVLGVRHHHERWDGTGYPNGLVGTDIPLFARVIAVADAFDAMTSSRPYRASIGRDEALHIVKAEAGRQFDPIVVEAFVSTLPSRIPAALFLPIFAMPRRVMREAAASFTRVGTGSLASALGAAGAVAVLGTASLPPPDADAPDRVAGERIHRTEVTPPPPNDDDDKSPRVAVVELPKPRNNDGDREKEPSGPAGDNGRDKARGNGGRADASPPGQGKGRAGKPNDRPKPPGRGSGGDDDGVLAAPDGNPDFIDDSDQRAETKKKNKDKEKKNKNKKRRGSKWKPHPHGGPPGQVGKDHPHGGPPGQTKKGYSPDDGSRESSPGDSKDKGHPHGGPPGQTKPKKNKH